MKKALKVIVGMVCECVAVAFLMYEAYDTWIRPKIDKIKIDTWHEAWNNGYKYGCDTSRFDVLYEAYVKEFITKDEHDELTKD